MLWLSRILLTLLQESQPSLCFLVPMHGQSLLEPVSPKYLLLYFCQGMLLLAHICAQLVFTCLELNLHVHKNQESLEEHHEIHPARFRYIYFVQKTLH